MCSFNHYYTRIKYLCTDYRLIEASMAGWL